MKLKCPGCGKILQVPDSAAGKVVKCRCGKQLRVPGGDPTAANRAAANRAATNRGTANGDRPSDRPVAQPAAGGSPAGQASPRRSAGGQGGFGDFDPGLFDELTDSDFRAAPAAATAPDGGGKLMKQYAPPDEVDDAAEPPSGKRPAFLTFLGVVNAVWAVIFLLGTLAVLGLVAVIPAMGAAAEFEDGQGMLLAVAVAAMAFSTLLAIATAVSCFVPKKICWYVVLFSYAFACGERIVTVTDMFRAGEEVLTITGGFVGVLVGFLFLAALHADNVRRFYRIGKLTVGKVIAPDLIGFLLGLGLSIGINFLG